MTNELADDTDAWVLELSVLQLRLEADGVTSLELTDPEGGLLPSWKPGAHIDLLLGAVTRQYSLCGDPGDRTSYHVAVLREQVSRGGSAYVHDRLHVGELLEVGGPRNHFRLDDHDDYIFIAGGIGITPIRPMIYEVRRRGRPWRLFYGGRSRSSMAYIAELARSGPGVTVVAEDERGMLDLPAILPEPSPGTGIYACGPPELLEAIEKRCAAWPIGALHTERFQARDRSGAVDRPFVAECARSGVQVAVPAEVALIDALEAAGIRLPNVCRDGLCGSCETRVLAGGIEHRDSVLSAAEQQQQDRMMACVSRAADERVVLDL
jgi:tetrachlorobenzoquinone reductase